MAISQKRANRKPTGALYRTHQKKKKLELGSSPTHTKVHKTKRKSIRILGGNTKQRLLNADVLNLYDPKTKKHKKVKIKTILENNANRHFVRRNILTKGAVVDTEAGKAKITSRPGQEGTLNGVLV